MTGYAMACKLAFFSVAFSQIENNKRQNMNQVEHNVKEKIQRFVQLANQELRVNAVFLFGSNAKGTTHAWSDIDLLPPQLIQQRLRFA
jgi:hypothetical protein